MQWPHRKLACLLVAVLLVGCGGNARAPVEDRYARPVPAPAVQSHSTRTTYRVQRGDTLYSIAFRYGMDFRKMAAANNIPAPYTIYPGQTIILHEVVGNPLSKTTPQDKRPGVASTTASLPPASKTASDNAAVPTSKSASTPAPPPASTAATPKEPAAEVYSGATVSAWRWPTRGRVTRGYSSSVHKGIDIDGRRGDAIFAVAPGKVVYAGTGIVGFGELLIIKHNDVYLSAYGHNDRLLAREGQVVAAGEKIAEKGSSGTDAVKLHFEIRKEGKPVDPQRLLPRR